jgi:hypothetical protein
MVYAYLLNDPKAEWTTDEIKVHLKEIEPSNDKIKNVTTVMGQNTDVFIRIPKNESKPVFKLAKGADKLVLNNL